MENDCSVVHNSTLTNFYSTLSYVQIFGGGVCDGL